jgi:hypothetical protein
VKITIECDKEEIQKTESIQNAMNYTMSMLVKDGFKGTITIMEESIEKEEKEKIQTETINKLKGFLKENGFLIDEEVCLGFMAKRNPNDIVIRVWLKKL